MQKVFNFKIEPRRIVTIRADGTAPEPWAGESQAWSGAPPRTPRSCFIFYLEMILNRAPTQH